MNTSGPPFRARARPYVTAWRDPEDVRFRLESRSEPVHGNGRFYTGSDPTGTVIGFELDLQATGSAAPMINALLKKYVAELSGPFLAALRQDLQEGGGTVKDEQVVSVPAGAPGVVIVEYQAPGLRRWRTGGGAPACRPCLHNPRSGPCGASSWPPRAPSPSIAS
jgi:hypothetical protein